MTQQRRQSRSNEKSPKKPRVRREVEPEHFSRAVKVRAQAVKFLPEYRKDWAALLGKFGETSSLKALASIRGTRTPDVNEKQEVHRALVALAERYALPRAVDPAKIDDVPDVKELPTQRRYGWNSWEFGVQQVTDTPGPPILCVDVDVTRPARELLAGIQMLATTLGASAQQSPEAFGVKVLAEQPELVGPKRVRIDVDVSRPPEHTLQGLTLILRALGRAPASRLLRSRTWDGEKGWERAFKLLQLRRAHPEFAVARLTRLLDRSWWDNPANLHKRKAVTRQDTDLLRAAEEKVTEVKIDMETHHKDLTGRDESVDVSDPLDKVKFIARYEHESTGGADGAAPTSLPGNPSRSD